MKTTMNMIIGGKAIRMPLDLACLGDSNSEQGLCRVFVVSHTMVHSLVFVVFVVLVPAYVVAVAELLLLLLLLL